MINDFYEQDYIIKLPKNRNIGLTVTVRVQRYILYTAVQGGILLHKTDKHIYTIVQD